MPHPAMEMTFLAAASPKRYWRRWPDAVVPTPTGHIRAGQADVIQQRCKPPCVTLERDGTREDQMPAVAVLAFMARLGVRCGLRSLYTM